MHFIEIKTSFIGYHRYLKAPKEVAFLRNYHRHIFYVKAQFKVDHSNRAIEFILLKREVNQYLKERYEEKYFELGCEQIAEDIFNQFKKYNPLQVSISEDRENAGGYCEVYDEFRKN